MLSIFMLGLALGSFIASRRLHNAKGMLALYGMIEIAIAIMAMACYGLLHFYPALYSWFAGFLPESTAYLTIIRVVFATLALLPATTLMGATLPILSAYSSRNLKTIGTRLSFLYGLNTIGAVTSVLLAGFVLLPYTTMNTAWAVAIITNIIIGIIALKISKRSDVAFQPPEDVGPQKHNTDGQDQLLSRGRLILWGIALSGFCALGYEVLWTRVLIIGIGATDYGFTSMLASFLTGIGIGSALFGLFKHRFPTSPNQLVMAFGVVQILIGTTIILAIIALYDLPAIYLTLQHFFESLGLSPFNGRQFSSLALAFYYLGAPALLMGISFPLAGEIYAHCQRTTGRAVGEVAAANTIGAIIGAAISGYAMIYLFGIERSIHLLLLINIGYGLFVVFESRGWSTIRWMAPTIATGLAVMLIVNPDNFKVWDKNFFAVYRSKKPEDFASRDLIAQALRRYQVLYYGEGASSIVAASKVGKLLVFSTNGRVEATTGAMDVQNQYALGHLPMMLHKEPKEVLVIGGGSGMTLGSTAVYPSVNQVTLAELEPKVLGVINAFAPLNHNILSHPKLKVVFNDGRNYLLTIDKKYDVITADPIHPWFRGAGYLYTEEYFKLVASRLNEGGTVSQWLPLYQMQPEHIRSVLKTFNQAFDHSMIFMAYADAILLGSNQPIELDIPRLRAAFSIPEVQQDLGRVGMGSVEKLLSYFMMGTSGVRQAAQPATINTDNNLYLEFFAPRAIGKRLTEWKNIKELAHHRESIMPYLKNADNDLIATLRHWEDTGIYDALDDCHILMQSGQFMDPQFNSVYNWLGNRASGVGRWEFIQAVYQAKFPKT